ncbi:MAG TPA: phosphoenolpyruvate carboxykinase (ATP), partial [Clostridiaceae bacterium]|nr:phosphoenolpyruvate carboxykinase (ATP) [Clostridiaceae bacterium]
AEMLGRKIDKFNADVYLVNTGWAGGPYGVGKRMKLSYTRAMVTAAISGKLKNVSFKEHPVFKVLVPESCPDVPSEILNPKNTWSDKAEYDRLAAELALKFNKNFEKFKNVSDDIKKAAPNIK